MAELALKLILSFAVVDNVHNSCLGKYETPVVLITLNYSFL